jgi:hypothetical protein
MCTLRSASHAADASFRIQLAASCLGQRRRVVWVGPFRLHFSCLATLSDRSLFHLDGFHRVPVERLRAAAGTGTGEGQEAGLDRLDGFAHYTCPSLPHLIALLCRPTASSIPPGTSLVVVDSLSALLNHAFPKLPEPRPARDGKGNKGKP